MCPRRQWLLGIVLLVGAACRSPEPPAPSAIALWHTFGAGETEALNEALARRPGRRVAATVLPFGRAQNRVLDVLAAGEGCPDLVRVDATWVPALASRGLLLAPSPERLDTFTPAALELGGWNDRVWGLPQTMDGLALLYDAALLAETSLPWPPETLSGLETAARRLRSDDRHGMTARADGYWFTAWLRAAGGDLLGEDGEILIADPVAVDALRRYAALVTEGVAPSPSPSGDEAVRDARLFAAREVALWVGGPWSVAGVGSARERLAVAPYPRAPDGRPAAPRGGHLWVVPACAPHPEEGWALAEELTDPELQASWSRRLGLVPTRVTALAGAHPLARSFAAALEATRLLPRHPLTPVLFDDLTPAVEAVLAGEATAEEALAGVARSWQRLLEGAP